MSRQERIARSLREHGAALQESFLAQTAEVEICAERVTAVFHGGGRLLLGASPSLAPVAELTAQLFLHRLNFERPSLPAICLGRDATLAAALARDGQSKLLLARQLRACGGEADFFLGFGDLKPDPALSEAFSAARDLGCATALVLPARVNFDGEQPDLAFRLETAAPARVAELALFFGLLLCDLVEAELFGV